MLTKEEFLNRLKTDDVFNQKYGKQNIYKMALMPCHHEMQFNCRPDGYLDLQFSMRSSDVLLGLPWNFAFYGMLLVIIAEITNLKPGVLTYVGKKVHLYDNQFEAARETIARTFSNTYSDFQNEPSYSVSVDGSYKKQVYTREELNSLLESLNLDTIKFHDYKHLPKLQNNPEMLAYS